MLRASEARIRLEHGFHETKWGIRFTVSDAARVEVLDRLLELNHSRYAAEVAQGLHPEAGAERKAAKSAAKGKASAKAATVRVEPRKADATNVQPALFGAIGRAPGELTRDAKRVLRILEQARGALGKSELLEKSQLDESRWVAVLGELTSAGLVTQVGEKRGARYQRA